jgi:hypothetical protein
MGVASGGLGIAGNMIMKKYSDEQLRSLADGPMGGPAVMKEIQRRQTLGNFGQGGDQGGVGAAVSRAAAAASAPTGSPGSDSRFKSIEERLSKLEGGGEDTAVGNVSNTVTEFGKGYDFGTGGSAVAGNSTGMVNPPPMMPSEEVSFQADKSSRAFNPLQTKSIVAQYGSMKERNEAAGYYEK